MAKVHRDASLHQLLRMSRWSPASYDGVAEAMTDWPRLKRFLLFGAALAVVAASTVFSQDVWRENGLRSLQAVNEQRVQLVANAVKAEINRQDHVPVVLSLDPDVRNALTSRNPAALRQLSQKLRRISSEADTR